MVKHVQTIRRTNCLSVSDDFVGLAFKGLKQKTTPDKNLELHMHIWNKSVIIIT